MRDHIGAQYRSVRRYYSPNYKPLASVYDPERDVMKPACFVAFVFAVALLVAGLI